MMVTFEASIQPRVQPAEPFAALKPTDDEPNTPQIQVHPVTTTSDDWVSVRDGSISSTNETWPNAYATGSESQSYSFPSPRHLPTDPVSEENAGLISPPALAFAARRNSTLLPTVSSVERDVVGIAERSLQRRGSLRVQPKEDEELLAEDKSIRGEHESPQEHIYLSHNTGARSHVVITKDARRYTRSLELQPQWGDIRSPNPSSSDVITDAGEQLELSLRHKPSLRRDSSQGTDLTESIHLFAPDPDQDLQDKIYAEFLHSKCGQTEFFPRRMLCTLVNQKSVFQQLISKFPGRPKEEIRGLAKEICEEVTFSREGKSKIKSFRKVFALLVLVEAVEHIGDFLRDDISDVDLPLKFFNQKGNVGFCRRNDETMTPLGCMKKPKWSRSKLESFKTQQWKLLAPFFSKDDRGGVKHYKLDEHHILPFTALASIGDEVSEAVGGFGKVFMAQIHPDHHNFPACGSFDRGFAIKEQRDEKAREIYKKEVEILKNFSGQNSHPNIISLLASYEQFNRFHLIFDRADATLFSYWENLGGGPSFNADNVIWLIDQCRGLLDGLLRLHRLLTLPHPELHDKEAKVGSPPEHSRQMDPIMQGHKGIFANMPDRIRTESFERPTSPIQILDQTRRLRQGRIPKSHPRIEPEVDERRKIYGRHGDIHPKNILWFDDGSNGKERLTGTLKLADFGAAELHSSSSRSEARNVVNHPTYRPPEWDLDSPIRQSYDIWCLGGVFLEFVAWILGGPELKNEFVMKRWKDNYDLTHGTKSDSFFEIISDASQKLEVRVKRSVTLFIGKLHKHPSCSDCLHELLNFIQLEMLVIDATKRKSCEQTWKFLEDMLQKCRQDEIYAAGSNPWRFKNLPWPYSVRVDELGASEEVVSKLTFLAIQQSHLRERKSTQGSGP